ncbi:hypothetical protein [Mangrovitalea sediminis]|uniref:hypothetical protein n=1 Tax=Mangrovitalea sediminis TaxID=1982043 RepID=UPI000BE4BA27|nr:hypothetical protein [Mangrovitalea sediminis]
MKAVTPSLALQDNVSDKDHERLAGTANAVLMPKAFPSTPELLVSGGDPRIELDRQSGANRYGCAPLPDPALLAFGSSTASVISAEGFTAADYLRRRIAHEALLTPAETYNRELERIRRELHQLLGLGETDIIFGASGTDVHLIAGQLTAHISERPVRAVMVEASETGSGVPQALSGCHFSTQAALGMTVQQGTPLNAPLHPVVDSISLRDANGRPRLAADVDAEVVARVEDAIRSGFHVLLVMADLSKSGLIAPSAHCITDIRQRWPATDITVLVDACQFRLAPATLRAYLGEDFLVAITGSKFLTGPTFSGALLVPAALGKRFAEHPLPASLRHYCARGEWPQHWQGRYTMDDVANFGLLLRWEAALQELRAFSNLPGDRIESLLQAFAEAVETRLQTDAAFEAVMPPPPDRQPIAPDRCWDRLPTMFTFKLIRSESGRQRPLDMQETRRIYTKLAQEPRNTDTPPCTHRRVQLGQPIHCGSEAGRPIGALRLCLSSRLIVDALSRGDTGVRQLIDDAFIALDKTDWLIRNL